MIEAPPNLPGVAGEAEVSVVVSTGKGARAPRTFTGKRWYYLAMPAPGQASISLYNNLLLISLKIRTTLTTGMLRRNIDWRGYNRNGTPDSTLKIQLDFMNT